ncbi:MAG: hypothetical protein HRU15_04545, partial [Planctomycetes bacterium]|nr:hypothetical protein [Planctomycetota bacterium]
DEQLGIAGRGDTAYITTFPDEDLDHEYDLCTTDVCPVGALTGKHFRFQQRVWFLQSVESINPFDSLGANITIDFNQETVWRIMPRRNPDVNKSWISNSDRLRYKDLGENRLLEGKVDGTAASIHDTYMAIGQVIKESKNIAVVLNGQLSNEDNASFLALADKIGGDVFRGSWLNVGKADGIARSGDPIGNRKGLELMGVKENIQELVDNADSYDCVLILGQDLCAENNDKATELAGIKNRIFIGSWNSATCEMANYALPVRSWAESRGTMVNCDARIQVLQACPVCPNQDMDAVWQAAVRISAAGSDQPLPWVLDNDAWKEVQKRAPALEKLNYRLIGPMGCVLESETATVETQSGAVN